MNKPKYLLQIIYLMKKKLVSVQSADAKRLIKNIFSLSIVQGINYILPLITFPYQVHILGVEKFGLLAFASATIGYFQVIVDYGFNLSVPRQISINRENKEKISEIVSCIIIIKVGLVIVSALLLFIFVNFFAKLRSNSLVFYLTFVLVVCQGLFPVWFFQGMEQMKYITGLNISSRIIFTLLIFNYVKSRNDFLWVPILNSIGSIIAVLGSWIIIKYRFDIHPSFQSFNKVKKYFIENTALFLSRAFINIYTISTTFILGIFTNSIIVGYYVTADKIVQIIKSLYGPISQSLYPYISKIAHHNKELALMKIRKITKLVALITLLLSIVLFFSAKIIIFLIAGKDFIESITILRIMSFLPFIVALSNIAGIQTMLTFGKDKAFSVILLIASLVSLLLSIILVPLFKHYGTAITVVIVEVFVTTSMIFYLKRQGLELF
jgi:PST family polysaccharide transporter